MKKNKIQFYIFSLVILFTVIGCKNSGNKRYEINFQLGTLVELTIYKGGSDTILKDAFNLIEEMEKTLSRNIELSEISEINRRSGISPVKVSDDTFFVIKKSIYYSELSEGFFDVTIGPLVSLWGIGTEGARVPAADEINNVLDLIDYRKMKLTPLNNLVFLEERGMEIDLGAIAKGFIADKVCRLFKEDGVKSAIINLGGDVALLGRKQDGNLFRIGIQNPFENRGGLAGIYEGEDVAIVTSGIYERYFEENGNKYHHIFNPKTGYPADNDIAGITVITAKATDADALSTSLFMFGSKEALALAEKFTDTEVIIITKDKKVILSSGIKSSFKITNRDFVLAEN